MFITRKLESIELDQDSFYFTGTSIVCINNSRTVHNLHERQQSYNPSDGAMF